MEDNMEFSEACSDVWYLLESLKPSELCKIPKKLLETIHILKIDDYKPNIDLERPLEEQKLSNATIGLISFIYNNYLGTKEEKDEYERTYKEYVETIEEGKSYEFNFKKKDKEKLDNISTEMTVLSEKINIFTKIINKIKQLFCKGN